MIEALLMFTAAFLFGRGLYHSGVLAGWITKGLRMSLQPKAPPLLPPAPPKRFDPEAAEIALFLDVPLAWWLDPNRWGDNPNWRDSLPRPTAPSYLDAEPPVPAIRMPRCPVCEDGGTAAVLAVHGGEVSLWDCFDCGAEFTRKGETRKSRNARLAREKASVIPRGDTLPDRDGPPAAPTTRSRLPCGCTGNVFTRAYPTGGWDMGRYAECETCAGTWDYAPKYGDTGNPRQMVRGTVEWPNGIPSGKLIPPPPTDR